jgi:hypothetical protein
MLRTTPPSEAASLQLNKAREALEQVLLGLQSPIFVDREMLLTASKLVDLAAVLLRLAARLTPLESTQEGGSTP